MMLVSTQLLEQIVILCYDSLLLHKMGKIIVGILLILQILSLANECQHNRNCNLVKCAPGALWIHPVSPDFEDDPEWGFKNGNGAAYIQLAYGGKSNRNQMKDVRKQILRQEMIQLHHAISDSLHLKQKLADQQFYNRDLLRSLLLAKLF